MKKITPLIFCAALTVFASCDMEFDLGNIDDTIAVGQNLKVPLNVKEGIKLNEYTTIDLGSQVINIQSFGFDLPAIPNPGAITQEYIEGESESANDMAIEQNGFPAWVTNIKELNLNTTTTPCVFTFTLSLASNPLCDKGYLAVGTRIVFPDWLEVASCSSDYFQISNSRTEIALVKDMYFEKNTVHNVPITVSGLDFRNVTSGVIPQKGKFAVTGNVKMYGKVKIMTKDLKATSTESRVEFDVKCLANNLSPESTVLTIDPNEFDYSAKVQNINVNLDKAKIKGFKLIGKVSNSTSVNFMVNSEVNIGGKIFKPESIKVKANANNDAFELVVKDVDGTFSKIDDITFKVKIVDYKGEDVALNMSDEILIEITSFEVGEDGIIL